MKVLLVDDEEEFVSALAERLLLRGIDAEWVTIPEDAVSKADKMCYNIAVLDIKMPRIGGIALKKLLQKKCPNMKFIFLTGHGSEDMFKQGISEAGIDYYLIKPMRIEELIEKIQLVNSYNDKMRD